MRGGKNNYGCSTEFLLFFHQSVFFHFFYFLYCLFHSLRSVYFCIFCFFCFFPSCSSLYNTIKLLTILFPIMNWQYAENLDILEVGNKQRLNFISYITSFRNIFNNDSMIRYIDILVIFFIDSVVLNCIDHKQDDSMNYETKNRYY